MKNVIYMLICPLTGENRYVGKAKCAKSRLAWHLQPKNRKANNHKNHWINKIMALGLKPTIEAVVSLPPDELSEAEIFYIAYFRSIGCRLTNSTDGGEGALGRVSSEESIAKMSASAKARDWTDFVPHNKQVHSVIEGIEHRKCGACELSKPIKEFCFRNKKRVSYQTNCVSCAREITAEHRKANPPTLLTEEEHAVIREENHRKSSVTLKKMHEANPHLKLKSSIQNSKAIQGVNVLTKEVITFSSALKAKEAGFQNTNIGQAIKLNKNYRGYSWSFI